MSARGSDDCRNPARHEAGKADGFRYGVVCGVGNGGDALGTVAILAIVVGLVHPSATAILALQRWAAQSRRWRR